MSIGCELVSLEHQVLELKGVIKDLKKRCEILICNNDDFCKELSDMKQENIRKVVVNVLVESDGYCLYECPYFIKGIKDRTDCILFSTKLNGKKRCKQCLDVEIG